MASSARRIEGGLIRAARSLDQGDDSTIPEKLDNVLQVLELRSAGPLHAAEELILRWLLKNMNGSSEDAERLRRYPAAWRILSILFSSMPLFSLAKSLADRRFVNVLQTTLSDICETADREPGENEAPIIGENAADIIVQPRKRQKLDVGTFSLVAQRQPSGLLQTSQALFAALTSIVARTNSKPERANQSKAMGSEHIKSLFSSHASMLKDIIAPLFRVCESFTHHRDNEFDSGQSEWISTISAFWDMHLKSSDDASEIATHVSGTVLNILAALTGDLVENPLGISIEARPRWTQDLRHFLTRNLILPARAAFLNRKTTEAIQFAVEMAAPSAAKCFPIVYDLVLSLPRAMGDLSAKRQTQTWNQQVFGILESSLRGSHPKTRSATLRTLLEMAHKSSAVIPIQNLASICRECALRRDRTDWSFLVTIITLSPDVFIAEEQQELLDEVLRRTIGDGSLTHEEHRNASSFLILLANGFVKARDLAGYLKKWTQYITLAADHFEKAPDRYRLWFNDQLSRAVAQLIQKAMNPNQVLSFLEWLGKRDAMSEGAPLTIILEAIALGLTQDDFVDAVGTLLVDMVLRSTPPALSFVDKPNDILVDIAASRWKIIEKSIHQCTVEQAQTFWVKIAPELKITLEQLSTARRDTFHAFRCSAAMWLASHPGGTYEEEAATITCDILNRVSGETIGPKDFYETCIEPYARYLIIDNPCLLSLIVERLMEVPSLIWDAILDSSGSQSDILQSKKGARKPLDLASAFLASESQINDQKIMDELLKKLNLVVGNTMPWTSSRFRIAAQVLLDIPSESFTRSHRESTYVTLNNSLHLQLGLSNEPEVSDFVLFLSLMIKLMRRPTFPPNMTFDHLDYLACYLASYIERNQDSEVEILQFCFPLLELLANLTTRQMTRNVGSRERDYIFHAMSLSAAPMDNTSSVWKRLGRMILLKTIIVNFEHPSVLAAIPATDTRPLKSALTVNIRFCIEQACSHLEHQPHQKTSLQTLLITLEATEVLDEAMVSAEFFSLRKQVLELSAQLRHEGIGSHWELENILHRIFGRSQGTVDNGLAINSHLLDLPFLRNRVDNAEMHSEFEKSKILDYVEIAVQGLDEEARLGILKDLLAQPDGIPDQPARLLSAYRVVQLLQAKPGTKSIKAVPDGAPGSKAVEADAGTFDVVVAYSLLCKRLYTSRTAAELVITARMLQAILEGMPAAITQWNVELTISTISTMGAHIATHPAAASNPKAYKWLCNLMQVVVKRHRLRLEGHFHLVVTVLQALLRALLLHPYDSTGKALPAGSIRGVSDTPNWAEHASTYSRLLTLICEPSVASVSRSQHHKLNSATDRAKRSAGQHMYLVLMLYIKLQLEQNVPHEVREALEPGVFSIFDITTSECMKIMNDAMDASGRAIMKELYKRYLKFGKWSGV